VIYYEIIEEPEKIREYYAHWDRMYDAGEYEASLSLEWTEALLNTHLDGDTFILLVLKDSVEILGIVPLCIRKKVKHGLSLITVFPTSEYFNTHSDLLLRYSSQEIMDVVIKAIKELKLKWDIFRIRRFVDTSPHLEFMLQSLKDNHAFRCDVSRAEPSFFIPLPKSYDEFLKNKSANFRHKLRSITKRIRSLGKVEYQRIRDFASVEEAYKTILSIEENSWKHKQGTAITCTAKQREFYRILCNGAYARGRLRLCVLCLNDEPIAFEMGLQKGRKYYGVHGSYNERYKKENPGTMLLAQFIEDLIKDGINEYDWFGEPFAWESRWTDAYRWHKSFLIYNKTTKAYLYYMYNILQNKILHRVKDQIVLRDPRSVKPQH